MRADSKFVKGVATEILVRLKAAVANGDEKLFEDLGLSTADRRRLERLNELDTGHLEKMLSQSDGFLTISLNQVRLERLLDQNQHNTSEEKLLQRLVLADAPNQLFYDCFGYPSDLIAEYRKRYDFVSGGKATELTLDEMNALDNARQAFEAQSEGQALERPVIALCLALFDQTGIPIRRFYRDLVGVSE